MTLRRYMFLVSLGFLKAYSRTYFRAYGSYLKGRILPCSQDRLYMAYPLSDELSLSLNIQMAFHSRNRIDCLVHCLRLTSLLHLIGFVVYPAYSLVVLHSSGRYRLHLGNYSCNYSTSLPFL